jgi:hypothetical protein
VNRRRMEGTEMVELLCLVDGKAFSNHLAHSTPYLHSFRPLSLGSSVECLDMTIIIDCCAWIGNSSYPDTSILVVQYHASPVNPI